MNIAGKALPQGAMQKAGAKEIWILRDERGKGRWQRGRESDAGKGFRRS
jgi:hypothetical protein